MKKNFTILLLLLLSGISSFALNPSHFTITRITAPYFIIDGNSPATLTSAYVGFEVKNNSNSATTYSNLRFTITSIGTSVTGQNYSIISPASGIANIGTLAPGETKVCYYYISYPASTTPQATFNVQLSDLTASWKTQSLVVYNRSSISANAGGTATQSFTNQDLIGGTVIDDVTYVVGNVQNGDETDFQVAVSSQFDPTKVTLLSTRITASSVPGITAGTTDSLYFISGNGSNGATVTVRWTFKITAFNFTTYLLPCAGATSGASNYKYALNTSLGSGTPVTVSSAANPLTITKASNSPLYLTNGTATFTVVISNPGIYGVSIDSIKDQLPTGFTYVGLTGSSQVTTSNSTSVPSAGATGTIVFQGGVSSTNTSFYIPASGSITLQYTATAPSTTAINLLTTVKDYVGITEVGSAPNTVSVSTTLPVSLLSFTAGWQRTMINLQWKTINEFNSQLIEIERKTAVGIFEKIGELSAAGFFSGENHYSFVDSLPAIGDNQYRLKLIDRDGQYKYSPVVLLYKKQTGITVLDSYPNPFANNLTVQVSADKSQPVQVRILDISGNAILIRNENCIQGTTTILLNSLSALPAGNYMLQILTADEKLLQRVVKL
jgi:Secretion system C-terminal sorting domain